MDENLNIWFMDPIQTWVLDKTYLVLFNTHHYSLWILFFSLFFPWLTIGKSISAMTENLSQHLDEKPHNNKQLQA